METPTITTSAPFKRNRSFTLIAAGAAGFFAKNPNKGLPGLTVSTPTKVIGVDASVCFTLTQQKRLALQLAFEMGLMFDPSSKSGNYMAVPMAVALGLRYDLTSSVALDLRVGGGGVMSALEAAAGEDQKPKMHAAGLFALNFFFVDVLHVGFDTWFAKNNSLIVIKFGFGF
jgi:hypothetical protein